MTLRKSDKTEAEIMQVRDRTLKENYNVHDVAQGYLRAKLEQYGVVVVQHGDDAREASEVFFGDGPDIAIYASDDLEGIAVADDATVDDLPSDVEPLGYVEVKSKRAATGQEWFGRLNRRHWNSYVEFASQTEVPVFVYFALVDEDENVIQREAFIEIDETDKVEGDVTNLSETLIAFDPEAVEDIEGRDLVCIDAEDIVGFMRGQVADGIPSVHGNDVVCLNEDECRSWQWLAYRLDL